LWEGIIAGSRAWRELVRLGATAAAAQSAWAQALAWELDWRSAAWRDTEEAEAFLGWTRGFQEQCRAQGWISAAELTDEAARMAAPAGPVLLAGFDTLPPAVARLGAAWRAQGVAVREAAAPGVAAAMAPVTMARDRGHELELAAAWARGLLDTGEPGPIGIVLPDLGAVRGQAERRFMAALHPDRAPWSAAPPAFHLSLGRPLAQTGPAAAVLSVLAAAEDARGVELGALLPWLQSPYLGGPEPRGRLAWVLRDRQQGWWRWERLRGQARAQGCGAWAEAMASVLAARRRWPGRQGHGKWAEAVAELAQAAGWPGERELGSEEFQAAQAWERTLREFAQLDEVAPEAIGAGEARRRLEQMAQRIFQPQAASAPVQVLGWEEAAGEAFRHLWIAGMEEGAMPRGAAPDAFLPIALQRDAGIPRATAAVAAAQGRRQWERLLASAGAVRASWAAHAGDEVLRPSPLLVGWKTAAAESAPSAAQREALETIADACGPAAEAEERHGNARMLEEQAACPFRAFAHQRLHAKAAEALGEGLAAGTRGTLLHDMLKVLWSLLQTQAGLLRRSPAELEALARDAAEAIVAGEERLEGQPGLARLEQQRLVRTTLEWMEIERERTAFEVVATEQDAAVEFAGLSLRLRRDRLDRMADGGLMLLDYKSGQQTAKSLKPPRMEAPQLPLYLVTHPEREKFAALAFAQVRTGAMKLIEEPASSAAVQAWQADLEQLAQAYLAGEAAVAPKQSDTCDHCDLHPLCRIRESWAPKADDDGD
ncbi:MAG: PD-(D/E)XK nuclease family protein, partial [Terriglobales bacterium]